MVTLTLRHMIKAPVDNMGWISSSIGTLIQSKLGQAILVFDNSVKVEVISCLVDCIISRYISQAVAIAKGDEDGANIIEKSQNASNLDYIIFAKLLDRLLCVIFVVIYISMFFRLIP